MKYRNWLRGYKFRRFKHFYGDTITISGIYYKLEDYDEMIQYMKTLKIGDEIYNIYKDKMEKIKEIKRSWENFGINYCKNMRFLFMEFITDTDYIIHDISYSNSNYRDWIENKN